MVDGCYFYRGMSLNDLDSKSKIILDPKKNPLSNIMPLLMEYSEFLLNLTEKGLEFSVNDFYVEPLQKVLSWTIRDIKNPGIDFTTNYADAAAYAFNYAGSQIKHNFKIIANTIGRCKNQPCFSATEKKGFLQITKKARELLLLESSIKHKPIVLKVKRSCEAFQNNSIEELNLGSYQFFLKRVVRDADKNSSLMPDKIAFFLHRKSQVDNFNVRLVKSLHQSDIEEIIKF
ncbi:conserved hypothetical protein [Gammaproteobacteria bacterium]